MCECVCVLVYGVCEYNCRLSTWPNFVTRDAYPYVRVFVCVILQVEHVAALRDAMQSRSEFLRSEGGDPEAPQVGGCVCVCGGGGGV